MLEIRKLRLDDDLTAVAELIYKTDIYIYPYWLDNVENAKKLLPSVIKRDTIYGYKNILVALWDGEIAGCIVYMDKFPERNLEETLAAYQDCGMQPNERFKKVNAEYFETLETEENIRFINCCTVFEKYRGRGIAGSMLDWFEDTPLSLTAVKDNERAISVYRRKGFEYVCDYPGFLGIPCIEMRKGGK